MIFLSFFFIMQILICWLEMDWKTITRFSNKRTEVLFVAFKLFARTSIVRTRVLWNNVCMNLNDKKTINCIAQSAFLTIGKVCLSNKDISNFVVLKFSSWIYSLWNNVCMNYRRRTTKTVHRISIPRMIVIIRQVLKRILRCSLGIVKPCLALLLCSYQVIMTPNDQIKAKAVEHNDLEGKQLSFICNKIVLMPDKFQWYFLLFC